MAAVDEPIKREGGTPVGDSTRSDKIEIGQEAALGLGRHFDNDDDGFVAMREGGLTAGSLKSAKVETGQKEALAHPKLPLLNNNSVENEQVNDPDIGYKVIVQKTVTETYKRKRRWPAKSEIAHNPVVVDKSYFKPPATRGKPPGSKTTKNKRVRPPGSKTAKNKEDCNRSSETGSDLDTVRSLGTFEIMVGGSTIDHKRIPVEQRRAYQGLCRDRGSLLHGSMQKPMAPSLAASVIEETVRIAEGIRAFPASRDDLARWKNTLESFEHLGMDVGFMRERIDGLLSLLTTAECPPGGYEEVKLERDRAMVELRALESKLSNIKDALKEMDVELQEITASSARKKKKSVDQAMRQLAATPW